MASCENLDSSEMAGGPPVEREPVPDTPTKIRKKYRPPPCNKYYLVKFKKDNIMHVCRESELLYQRRKRDCKIAPFAKYDGVWYECRVLDQSKKKGTLQQELHAAKKRSETSTVRRRKKTGEFALVRFHRTRDFQVVASEDASVDPENPEWYSIKCPDGVIRTATLIQKGCHADVSTRLNTLRDFEELSTPEKLDKRNPLLELTPRVRVERHPPQVTVFKRTLSMQSNDSCSPQKHNSPQKVVKADLEEEVKDATPEAVDLLCDVKDLDDVVIAPSPSEKDPLEDPYATDSGSDYRPSGSDYFSSPAPSIASEIDKILSPVIAEIEKSETTVQHDVAEEQPVIATSADLDKSEVDVHQFTEQPGPSRKYVPYKRKSSACFFCKKLVTRTALHMTLKHSNEPQVASLLAIADDNERRNAWKNLRLEGNYKHNISITAGESKGKLIVQRSTRSATSNDDYLPCTTCKGFFYRRTLYKHVKICQDSRRRYERVQGVSHMSLKEALGAQCRGPGLHILTTVVYPVMNMDAVTRVAQADEMIVRYGSHYCSMNMQEKNKQYLRKTVSQNMRQLARLLMTLRKSRGPECVLKQFLNPQRFDDLVEGVNVLSGLKDGQYASPSLPVSLEYSLKTCANLLKSQYGKDKKKELEESMVSFLSLINNEWGPHLTVRARKQLRKIKFFKRTAKILPLAEDIMTFVKYLRAEETRLVAELREQFSYSAWSTLNMVLLCGLVVFNRKRVGDVDKIQLDCYKNKCDASPDSAIYESLSESERLVAASFMHFYTRGKKDSLVPVMVPKTQIPSFDCMIAFRRQAEVSEENPFLFGRREFSFFDGSYAFRRLSEASQAKNSKLLRSTALRKHIATMSQVMNMNAGDLDILANYLGHSIDVHRNFYRLPQEALHLARISKLLMMVSLGNVEAIRGKSLDDIPMPDNDATVDYLLPENESADEVQEEESPDSVKKRKRKSRKPTSSSPKQRVTPKSAAIHKTISQRRAWSTKERSAVLRHLSDYVQEHRAPNKAAVVACMADEPVLRSRSWLSIKDFVRNLGIQKQRLKQPPTV